MLGFDLAKRKPLLLSRTSRWFLLLFAVFLLTPAPLLGNFGDKKALLLNLLLSFSLRTRFDGVLNRSRCCPSLRTDIPAWQTSTCLEVE